MDEEIKIITVKGQAILPYISDLAKLRITIFNEYPYLYEGDLEYEKDYLQTYVSCPESVVVVALDKDKVVGASTAIPLEFETPECKQPFLDHEMKIKDIFYLGESVLLHQYRGKKIYRHFFQERESAASQYGCHMTAFCGVERSLDDPRRPANFVPLDNIWEYFGYTKHPELRTFYEWKEIGEDKMSKKPLIFWLKNL